MTIKMLVVTTAACSLLLTGCARTQSKTQRGGNVSVDAYGAEERGASKEASGDRPRAAPIVNATDSYSHVTIPSMQFDASKQYTAILKTSAGNIEVALNHGQTPNTVKNFVELSRKGFYNGTIFHRVMKGFMIQGGDPKGDGTGGPGYRFDDEPFDGEYTRGTIAMANAGPNTNGSQFFIMHADYPLPKNYVIFGKVIKGMDTVDVIANAKVGYSAAGEPSQPLVPTVVDNVEIMEK